jgi:hypothetical protein
MTGEEWADIVEWVDVRYPKSWRAEQAVAYFHDLKRFDPSDVWTVVLREYERGRDFAPSGSVLLAGCLDERSRTAREEMYRKELPEVPRSEKLFSLAEFAERRFGRKMTGQELVEAIWKEKHGT